MTDYSSIVDDASQQFNVPADLIKAVIQKESNGNPYAIGSIGERGLMQLTPKYYPGVNAFDPRANIMAGTKSLSEYYKRYGNWKDALSFYNGGAAMPAASRRYADDVLSKSGLKESDRETQKAQVNTENLGKVFRFLGGGTAAENLNKVWPDNPVSKFFENLPANRIGRALQSGDANDVFTKEEQEISGEVMKENLRKYGMWALAVLLIGAGVWRLVNA